MDKFTLKDWFDLDEAAEYLTSQSKNQVSTFSSKDIVQLFLQEKLTLSIFLADEMVGKYCRFLKKNEFIDDFFDEENEEKPSPFSFYEVGTKSLIVDGEIFKEIRGVCDLPMIGSEKNMVLDFLESDYDLGRRELRNNIGVIVSQNGSLYQLCEYWGERDEISIYNPFYYDKKSVIKNVFLCVRKENLEGFIEQNMKPSGEVVLNDASEKSLYKIIYTMARTKYGFDPDKDRNKSSGLILKDAQQLEVPIDQDTISKWLKVSARQVKSLLEK